MNHYLTKAYQELPIIFTDEGWVNATQTAKQFQKDVRGYTRSKQFESYANALANKLDCDVQNLHITQKGNSDFEQGTFLHPKLAVDFARWISSEFALWMDEQISELLNKGKVELRQSTDNLSPVMLEVLSGIVKTLDKISDKLDNQNVTGKLLEQKDRELAIAQRMWAQEVCRNEDREDNQKLYR